MAMGPVRTGFFFTFSQDCCMIDLKRSDYMEKYGFSLQDSYAVPMPLVLDLLADTGFCAVSPGWQREQPLDGLIRHSRYRSLTVQSLHGPLRGMPAMWSPDPETAGPILQDLLQSAEDCARLDIPLLVVHPWNGVDYTFAQDGLCFRHFDALVDRVRQFGIRVAFENLEGPEYLAALLDRYTPSDGVDFCWDSGHERCYTPGWDFLRLYPDRLAMTHLNDNLGVTDPSGRLRGTDDLHLLPGDGNLDWETTLHRLKTARPQEILNFELKIRPKGSRCTLDLYSKLPPEQYFREAFQKARQAVKDYFR